MPFATGNWGCGEFGGDAQLKSLIQLLACSYVGRNMVYRTFGAENMTEFGSIVKAMQKANISGSEAPVSVGKLYSWLIEYRHFKSSSTCFDYVKERLRHL